MMPARRSQNWLPGIFNDFFGNEWVEKTNTASPAIKGKYLRREFSYSRFQQIMVLPENVEKDKIDAKVENGVLTIDLPKKVVEPEEKRMKEIAIK